MFLSGKSSILLKTCLKDWISWQFKRSSLTGVARGGTSWAVFFCWKIQIETFSYNSLYRIRLREIVRDFFNILRCSQHPEWPKAVYLSLFNSDVSKKSAHFVLSPRAPKKTGSLLMFVITPVVWHWAQSEPMRTELCRGVEGGSQIHVWGKWPSFAWCFNFPHEHG